MPSFLERWFNSPAMLAVVVALIGQMLTLVWWGSKQENRITMAEARLVIIEHALVRVDERTSKLAVIEDRQNTVMEQTKRNSEKLDTAGDIARRALQLLEDHMRQTGPFRQPP